MPPFPPISPKILIALITSVIILAGVGAGYLISRSTSTSVASGVINTAKEVGSTDTKTFRDSAQGVIEKAASMVKVLTSSFVMEVPARLYI